MFILKLFHFVSTILSENNVLVSGCRVLQHAYKLS